MGCPEVCSVLTRRKGHVSRAILKLERLEVSVTGAKKRLKIPLLFLTSETLDFESEHVFESHEDLQRSTNMMLALTSFSMDQIGPNMGQIGPKQPILEVETQD